MASVPAPKGPYQGALGTLAAGSLWSGIFGFVYVPTRLAVDATVPADQPGWGPALAAATGSLASSTVRVPLQLVKARMARREFFCSLQAFERILVREGAASLYRGWARSVASNLPFDATLFLLYDFGKTQLIAARQQLRCTAPQQCGLHGAGREPASARPCIGTACCSPSAAAADVPVGTVQIQRAQQARTATAIVHHQTELQQQSGVKYETGAVTRSVSSATESRATPTAGAAAAPPAVAPHLSSAVSSSPLAPADVAEAKPTAGRPAYGFEDAIMVGGVAGAAAGLLTAPLEAAGRLVASWGAQPQHKASSHVPSGDRGAEPDVTVTPRPGARRGVAAPDGDIGGGSEGRGRANSRGLGSRGLGRIRVLLAAGGLATRVAWAAFEGALFFPALETAIPLCDWVFMTDWLADREGQPRESLA